MNDVLFLLFISNRLKKIQIDKNNKTIFKRLEVIEKKYSLGDKRNKIPVIISGMKYELINA